jgi:imidazolonepropionase-like amidohydrolase
MRGFVICSTLVLALAAGGSPSAQNGPTVAFTNVAVLPMDSDRVLQDQTVVVADGKISAMGPSKSTPVPKSATTVEGRGKFLMPGLAEMHGHIPPPSAPPDFTDNVLFLYVARGVTTVRGMQGAPGQLELRERAKAGTIVSPTLYLAGPAFSGNAVKTPEEAAARVRQQKQEGWDLLKVLPGLSVETYDAMAKAAKEAGIRFAGHVPAAVGVPHALAMGQDTIDHIDGYAEHLDGQAKPVDDKGIADLVAMTKKAGTWIVPTLVVWETLRGPVTLESRTSLPELKYMPRETVEQWTGGLQKRLTNPQTNAEHARIYIDNRMRIMRALHKGGVGILLGSDAPQQFNVPGFSVHHEMRRMADAGMTNYEILKSGTADVGRYYASQDDFGTIAPGKRADLLLLDANPLQNLANAERLAGVMVRGRWFAQADLQKRLDAIAATYSQPRPKP